MSPYEGRLMHAIAQIRDKGGAGSNPATPTIKIKHLATPTKKPNLSATRSANE